MIDSAGPDYYIHTQGREFLPSQSNGYLSIPVLEFLNGKPWGNLTLNYIRALRPSVLRVILGEETTDAQRWRVSVYLEKDGRTIQSIEQEVEVGLRGGCKHGGDLRNRAMLGIMPQVKKESNSDEG